MARWIKADGTEQEVHPAAGNFFFYEELKAMINGVLTCIVLGEKDGKFFYLYLDDEALGNKPVNEVATTVLFDHIPDYPYCKIHGDVVVVGNDETGDKVA